MQVLAIVALGVATAVIYGVIHDQITVRICLEYFTIGHPRIFRTADPTLLALGWGVIATWWAGLLVGLLLAVAARAGSRPPLTAGALIRPLAWLMGVCAVGAALAGLIGWGLAERKVVFLVGRIAMRIPEDRHVPFLCDLWIHSASYFFGFVGGGVLAWRVWRSRSRGAIAVTVT